MSSTTLPPRQIGGPQTPGQTGQGQQGVPPRQTAPGQPLPPTGLTRQMQSIQQSYQATSQVPNVGFDPTAQQRSNTALPSTLNGSQGAVAQGSTSLQRLAEQLAKSYGLQVGRGDIVDANGNFLVTPDQVAAASGGSETMGMAAAKMNYIGEAMQRQVQKQQEQKSAAAISAGIGLVQSNARGSLATMQSGMYQNLANLYQNNQFQVADQSYFIQKEQLDIAQDLMKRQEKLAKKQAQTGFITGVGLGVLGIATGNVGLIAGGAASAAGNAGGTGWF